MMVSDYSWVVKVLESCNNEKQVESCENLFTLFLKKWTDEISWERKTQLISSFKKIKNTKILNIQKKQS
jgi:hypothetical protein